MSKTGYDPVQAADDIAAFKKAAENALVNLWNYINTFSTELNDAWHSNKAEEFGKKFEITINNQFKSCQDTATEILQKMQNAVNAEATANGQSGLPYNFDIYIFNNSEPFEHLVNNGTDQVMNITKVEVSLSNFGNNINSSINELKSLPMNLAVYDPAGEVQNACKELIIKRTEELSSMVSTINADIKSAMNTDIETLRIEEKQAEGFLS